MSGVPGWKANRGYSSCWEMKPSRVQPCSTGIVIHGPVKQAWSTHAVVDCSLVGVSNDVIQLFHMHTRSQVWSGLKSTRGTKGRKSTSILWHWSMTAFVCASIHCMWHFFCLFLNTMFDLYSRDRQLHVTDTESATDEIHVKFNTTLNIAHSPCLEMLLLRNVDQIKTGYTCPVSFTSVILYEYLCYLISWFNFHSISRLKDEKTSLMQH